MRVRVCFDCKQSCNIFPNNYLSNQAERMFNIKHAGHRLQTISLEECINWKKINKKKEENLWKL